MREVGINNLPVELFKILKFEGLVESGGAAKNVIAQGQVMVNGSIETQKRKKIVADDIIEFGREKIHIKLNPDSIRARAKITPGPEDDK